MRLMDLMTQNFSLIGESQSIAEARSKLTSNDYLVVTTDRGLPLTVITTGDLPNGTGDLTGHLSKLPPTVIIGCDLDVSTIQQAPTAYLLRKKTRGAAILDDDGIVGIVPVEAFKPYTQQKAAGPGILDPTGQGKASKGRIISYNFFSSGPPESRSLRVAAAGTLGGRRVLPAVPLVCKKCGWADFYRYVLPITKCKNPDKSAGPQPWPHTLL